VVWPTLLSAAEKSTVAAKVRTDTLAGAKPAHEQFGVEAEAPSFHITKKSEECHRCHRALDARNRFAGNAARQIWIGE
jgi:hypothetical protein